MIYDPDGGQDFEARSLALFGGDCAVSPRPARGGQRRKVAFDVSDMESPFVPAPGNLAPVGVCGNVLSPVLWDDVTD
jgi:hypothetical protein